MSLKRLVLVTLLTTQGITAYADDRKTIKLELSGAPMFNDTNATLNNAGTELSDQIASALLNSSATLRSVLITAHAEPRVDAESYAQSMATNMQNRMVAQGLGSLLVDTLSLGAIQPSRNPSASGLPKLHRRIELTITGSNLPRIKLKQPGSQAPTAQLTRLDKRPAPLPKTYIRAMNAIQDKDVQEYAYQSNWLFARSGANLSAPGKRAIKKLARQIKTSRNTLRVIVIGHANGFANERTNRSYSLSHARSVERYLQRQGVGKPIRTMTLGSRLPFADMTTAEGRKKNRRVEILVVSTPNNIFSDDAGL